tara:strand:- start:391 stop:816 length:426 start_codon:yes stop_codon:yes gene_type:complete
MIIFKISYKNDIKNIEYDSNKTLLSLKKHIINEYKLKSKYIDLNFKNETPIRGMGKFNLEKGIIIRTFDNYKLEKWNLENKEISCEIIEVDDYEPEKPEPIIKKQSSMAYRPSSKFSEIKSGDTYIQASFKLDSEEDFPSL